MKQKILISSSSFYRIPKLTQNKIKYLTKNYQIIKNPFKRRLKPNELIKYAKSCQGIIAGLEQFSAKTLEQLPRLKCISRDGVGTDNIDLKKAKKLGITVRNTPDANTQAVAELTIGLIISLLRHIPYLNNKIRKGEWLQLHGHLLEGKTVGIIGVGRIGKRLAQLLKPFGCHILGNDIYPDNQWFREQNISHVSKKELFSKSDIVSLHVSYLPQNENMINNQAFRQMKKGVILLNISRGGVIEEADLIKSLNSGKIAAAALDVFKSEPYKGPLTKMENVILTPHVGGSTHESRYLMQLMAVKNVVEELDKQQ